MGMDLFKIIFQPKSIIGLMIAAGILFLLIGGLTLSVNQSVSGFFIYYGKLLFIIGFVGWLAFFIPAVIRNWSR